MTVKEFADKAGYEILTGDVGLDNEIKSAYVGDLLSWVMAKGQPGTAWTTVQVHLNVIAVACLHDFSCVIIPDSIAVPDETLERAKEEEMPILSAGCTSFGVCKALAAMGVDEA